MKPINCVLALLRPLILIGLLLGPLVSSAQDAHLTTYMVGHRIDIVVKWRPKGPIDRIDDARLLAVDPLGLIFEAQSGVFSRRVRREHFYVTWDQVVFLNCRNCPSPRSTVE